jgi:hypothetical protein
MVLFISMSDKVAIFFSLLSVNYEIVKRSFFFYVVLLYKFHYFFFKFDCLLKESSTISNGGI